MSSCSVSMSSCPHVLSVCQLLVSVSRVRLYMLRVERCASPRGVARRATEPAIRAARSASASRSTRPTCHHVSSCPVSTSSCPVSTSSCPCQCAKRPSMSFKCVGWRAAPRTPPCARLVVPAPAGRSPATCTPYGITSCQRVITSCQFVIMSAWPRPSMCLYSVEC